MSTNDLITELYDSVVSSTKEDSLPGPTPEIEIEGNVVKKKRGRPTGSKSQNGIERLFNERNGRKASVTRWVPRKWQPEYEKMVILSVSGLSNSRIGQELGYTKEHISSILNLPEAEALRDKMIEQMRANANINISERLGRIAVKSVERLEKVLTNDELFEKSPFMVVDRGIEVLKSQGFMKHGNTNGENMPANLQVNGNATFINIPSKLGERIADGLKLAQEAHKLNAGVDGSNVD